MPRDSFSEQLWNGLGDALADIREKAVEEPWFGRVVTERGDDMHWQEATEAAPGQQGLSGEVLDPEHAFSASHESAGQLDRGQVLDAEPMSWSQATQALPYNPEEQNRDVEQDLDR